LLVSLRVPKGLDPGQPRAKLSFERSLQRISAAVWPWLWLAAGRQIRQRLVTSAPSGLESVHGPCPGGDAWCDV
jgi:hypothetical protein